MIDRTSVRIDSTATTRSASGSSLREPAWARHGLAIAMFVLLATRLALVLGVHVTPSSDPAWYYERAVEMLERGSFSENGIPTAFWPVGYPAFLAFLIAIFGRSFEVGLLANVALSGASLLLLHRWCMDRWGDLRVAALAAILFAVYPNQIGYNDAFYAINRNHVFRV